MRDLTGGFTPGAITDASVFSNFGPTDDGRIKPDLVAAGEVVYSTSTSGYANLSGTSQAAPTVAGSLGLQVELWQRYHGADQRPHASFLKGAAIHTANDLVGGLLTAGPDYRTGWGLFNTERFAQILSPLEGSAHGAHARMVQAANGVTLLTQVKAIGGQPLWVTLCWTDPSGDPVARAIDAPELMLKNDLELTVTATIGGVSYEYFAWVLNPANPGAAAERDHTRNGQTYNKSGTFVTRLPLRNNRDNVEQVYIPSPTAGATYTIKIQPRPAIGSTPAAQLRNEYGVLAPQKAALFVSGAQRAAVPRFDITSIARTGTNQLTIAWPAAIGSVYTVETSTNLATWTTLSGHTNILAQAALISRPITTTPSQPQRYYRVRKVL